MSYHFIEQPAASPDAPLVFTFHGTGGDETQFFGFAQQVLPGAAGPGAHYATVASVRLPGGRVLQGAGVTPDVEGVRSP